MSLSNPRAAGLKNPADKHIEWKGGLDQGYFQYYDKEIEDPTKRNIIIDLSDGFVILDDDTFSISGYDEASKSMIQSNFIRTKEETLVIKKYPPKSDKNSRVQVIHTGTYEDLMEMIRESKILSYTKSIYAFHQGELIHIKLSGSSFSRWIGDVQPNRLRASSFIHHTDTTQEKKGAVFYKVPHFTVGDAMDEDTLEQATILDRDVLQPYITAYLAQNASSKPSGGGESAGESYDTKQWRGVKSPGGQLLGEIGLVAMDELHEKLIFENATGLLIDSVGQAIYDYQQANREWKDKKTKDGKFLTEFTAAELKVMLDKIPPNNTHRIVIECAHTAKSLEEDKPKGGNSIADFDDYQEDDDIPF